MRRLPRRLPWRASTAAPPPPQTPPPDHGARDVVVRGGHTHSRAVSEQKRDRFRLPPGAEANAPVRGPHISACEGAPGLARGAAATARAPCETKQRGPLNKRQLAPLGCGDKKEPAGEGGRGAGTRNAPAHLGCRICALASSNSFCFASNSPRHEVHSCW